MAAPNPLDRLIGWINPVAGLRRNAARAVLTRAYEAANPADRWRPRRSGASANADHLGDAAILRAKARSCYQNVPYVRAGIDGLVSATVGSGVIPRANGAQADLINTLIGRWESQADADGRLNLAGLIAQAYRTMEIDGEVLIRLRPRSATDGLAIPLQLQVLEIDWIDSTRNNTAPGTNNRIINGIEYDLLGRVAAYWLWDSHPGDMHLARSLRTQSRRLDARYIIHLYNPERPGQGRGFTRLAPVLARVRDLALYEDAELARKNLETRLGVLYSGDPDLMANPTMGGQEPDVKSGDLGDLPSGGMTRLPAGASVEVVNPTVANGYVDALKFNLHIIAAGMGVTYEMLTGDGSDVNFSSARILRLNMKRNVEQTQWMVLLPMLLRPLHRAIVDAAVLGGRLRQPDYAMDATFPRWDYVNPQQEINADAAEVAAGMSSISEKIRARGFDPETVFAELQRDVARLREGGLLEGLLALQGKALPGAQPAASSARNATS
jgi:lambda family phage portal protein